jgi:hypothetical protein
MESIWYIMAVLVVVALALSINLANTPDTCAKACLGSGFVSGTGVNMRVDESCSSKFGMEYVKSDEYEQVKSPVGFKNVCCCEK